MPRTTKNSKQPVDLRRFEGARWNLPRCFIIHAWSPPGIQHVIQSIRTALEGNFHVDVDLDFGADDSIREKALAAIDQAAFVICILDDLVPNVVFEYGYAKALKKPCIRMVRNGAVVNVLKYFPKGSQPTGISNPPFDCNFQFSDVRDLVHCPYDHEDPGAAKKLLVQELNKQGIGGKALSTRILETWVALMKEGFGNSGNFEPLFDYISRTTRTIELDKPLFATVRQRKFVDLLQQGFKQTHASKGPTGNLDSSNLPDATIEAISDLPPESRLSVIRKLLKTYAGDERLFFAESYCVLKIAESENFRNELRNEEAISLCENSLAFFPESFVANYNYATFLYRLNRSKEAEKHYKEALRINPEYVDAHNNYANLLDDLNRKVEAEKHYKEALRISPEDVSAHYNFANLLNGLNRKEEAEKHYKEALRISPEHANAHNNYANLLDDLNQEVEAEKHYKEALRISPEHANAHNNYAVLLNGLNRKEEAEKHYKKSLHINPKHAETHNNYAILLDDLNRKEEAEKHYSKAIELSPQRSLFRRNFAKLLERLGRKQEAQHHLEEAARLDSAAK